MEICGCADLCPCPEVFSCLCMSLSNFTFTGTYSTNISVTHTVGFDVLLHTRHFYNRKWENETFQMGKEYIIPMYRLHAFISHNISSCLHNNTSYFFWIKGKILMIQNIIKHELFSMGWHHVVCSCCFWFLDWKRLKKKLKGVGGLKALRGRMLGSNW